MICYPQQAVQHQIHTRKASSKNVEPDFDFYKEMEKSLRKIKVKGFFQGKGMDYDLLSTTSRDYKVHADPVKELKGATKYKSIEKYADACGKVCHKKSDCFGFQFGYHPTDMASNECGLLLQPNTYSFWGPEYDVENSVDGNFQMVFIRDGKDVECKGNANGTDKEYYGYDYGGDEVGSLGNVGCQPYIKLDDFCDGMYTTYVNIHAQVKGEKDKKKVQGCGPDAFCHKKDLESDNSYCQTKESIEKAEKAEKERLEFAKKFIKDYKKGKYDELENVKSVGKYKPAEKNKLYFEGKYQANEKTKDNVIDKPALKKAKTAQEYAQTCSEYCHADKKKCIGFTIIFTKHKDDDNKCRLLLLRKNNNYFSFTPVKKKGKNTNLDTRTLRSLEFAGKLFVPKKDTACDQTHYLSYESLGNLGCEYRLEKRSYCNADSSTADLSHNNGGCQKGLVCIKPSIKNVDNVEAECNLPDWDPKNDVEWISKLMNYDCDSKDNCKLRKGDDFMNWFVQKIPKKVQEEKLDEIKTSKEKSLYHQMNECVDACSSYKGKDKCSSFKIDFTKHKCTLFNFDENKYQKFIYKEDPNEKNIMIGINSSWSLS